MNTSHCSPEKQVDKHNERGASLVEYALLVALIAVVCVGAVTFLGNNTRNTVDRGANGIGGSPVGSGPGQAALGAFSLACNNGGGVPTLMVDTGGTQTWDCNGGTRNRTTISIDSSLP